MCFYNSVNATLAALAARYRKESSLAESSKSDVESLCRVGAFSFSKSAVITSSSQIEIFNWGLIPNWVKSEQSALEIRKGTVNARNDSVFVKPSFKNIIYNQRCIIPSTGYFEWRQEDKNKIPYFIFIPESKIFSMAGVYDKWVNPSTGEIINSYSIITTTTNPLTDYIHNTKHRMPVILSKENELKWLDSNLNKESIEKLMIPYNAKKMDAYILNDGFLKKDPHDISLLEKYDPVNENKSQINKSLFDDLNL
ncbi:MAG: SOS response-associated peptidase [Bacteroidales bacterium]|nr:SOS response-associated peptidase [Bacteroidales bacterium]